MSFFQRKKLPLSQEEAAFIKKKKKTKLRCSPKFIVQEEASLFSDLPVRRRYGVGNRMEVHEFRVFFSGDGKGDGSLRPSLLISLDFDGEESHVRPLMLSVPDLLILVFTD